MTIELVVYTVSRRRLTKTIFLFLPSTKNCATETIAWPTLATAKEISKTQVLFYLEWFDSNEHTVLCQIRFFTHARRMSCYEGASDLTILFLSPRNRLSPSQLVASATIFYSAHIFRSYRCFLLIGTLFIMFLGM